MVKKLLVLLLVLNCSFSFAETIRTDVLVIGGGASGVAAAIQSSRSKLKTVLVEQGPWLGGSMTAGGLSVLDANRNLSSGIWGEFRKKVQDLYKGRLGYDTTYNSVLRFEPFTGAAILKKIADTVKNLTVYLNTPFTTVKKDGTGWEVEIMLNGNATTIKTKVLVDATETADVAAKAGAAFSTGVESLKDTGETLAQQDASPKILDITWIATLKDYGRNTDHTILKPEGYDAAKYACLKGKNIRQMLQDGWLPNEKYMINWTECGNGYPVSPDDLSPEHRAETYKKARLHTLGLVYYLQTELGFKNLGLDDGYNTPDHLPYLPYIREYRRAKGQLRMVLDDIYKPYDRESKLYRTAIAVGDAMPYQNNNGPKTNYPPFPAYSVPLGAVVVNDMDNLLVTEKAISVTHLVNASTQYPSVQMSIGQGVGTVAAYLAFFKTTTKNLNVRIIQGELLDFKADLLPFTDITLRDPNWRTIQQICATGLLKGIQKANGNAAQVLFMPDSTVATADVKPVIEEIYTRGFLWFNKEKAGEKFTVGNLLSLISEMTLTDPQVLRSALQKSWKTQYKFVLNFDEKRPVTRREFAVLVNRYINPFARRVDIAGKLLN